jgi:hypothetical protein
VGPPIDATVMPPCREPALPRLLRGDPPDSAVRALFLPPILRPLAAPLPQVPRALLPAFLPRVLPSILAASFLRALLAPLLPRVLSPVLPALLPRVLAALPTTPLPRILPAAFLRSLQRPLPALHSGPLWGRSPLWDSSPLRGRSSSRCRPLPRYGAPLGRGSTRGCAPGRGGTALDGPPRRCSTRRRSPWCSARGGTCRGTSLLCAPTIALGAKIGRHDNRGAELLRAPTIVLCVDIGRQNGRGE